MASSAYPSHTDPDGWMATRAVDAQVTRLMGDDEDEHEERDLDIGVRVSATLRELFVSCAASEALQQQFEHLTQDFIALHDVGTRTSRGLLARLAAASQQQVQRLSIRRQGFGNELAALEFVDLPTPSGPHLRIYSTEVDADTPTRHALSRTLLAYARLGVVMVGALPAHALLTALRPLHDAMRGAHWFNRQLLLMPLATPGNLAQIGIDLTRGTRVEVLTTPRVTRPSDAWNFISSSWNRLREAPASPPPPETPDDLAHSVPGGLAFSPTSSPLPLPTSRTPADAPAGDQKSTSASTGTGASPSNPFIESPLQAYVDRVLLIKGMVSTCVFDTSTGQALVHAGARPDAAALASHGQQLLSTMWASSRALGLGHAVPDAAITLGQHHLLLRPLPGHPGLALHAVLDQALANLTLARVQLQNLDGGLSG